MLNSEDRPRAHVIRVIEGFETVTFRSKFNSWPQSNSVAVSEDGRGKVAGQSRIFTLSHNIYTLIFLTPS